MGALLTWSLMGPCVFFFLSFLVDLSRSEDVFWFVQFRKMVQLEEQDISKKNNKKHCWQTNRRCGW